VVRPLFFRSKKERDEIEEKGEEGNADFAIARCQWLRLQERELGLRHSMAESVACWLGLVCCGKSLGMIILVIP
jgi:hypothetical protein